MLRKEGGRVETASVLETTSAARLNVAERLRRATRLWRALQRYDEAIDDVAEAQRATGDGFLAQRRSFRCFARRVGPARRWPS